MLLLILGKNEGRAKERGEALGGFTTRETVPSTISAEEMLNIAQSASLFEDRRAYVVSELFKEEREVDSFEALLPALAASEHLFLFEEETGVALAKKVEKAGGRVVRAAPEAPKEKQNPFALADAFGKHDRKNLWMLYRREIDAGAAPEQLIGMLAWKARSMAAREGDQEAKRLSLELVRVYHRARRGEGDMELLLERFILAL